ncbi:hypothetical protein [Alkalihalobacillus pseudalcaliphilus]|uniref:hypothetical protein n=1 Tax=Alkalihalobacillus pseudalcaliphilus TaxID=79884 RepID=UPI00064DC701|nr:hypothetical protein [Alkalihalobacillus pseudalcaliphilus]KMK75616.1 hypothetical protein AB990_10040 [Alkalihalobacillus pseudalcaliphilus]
MNNLKGFLSVIVIMSAFWVGFPIGSSNVVASTANTNDVIEVQQTRTVTVTRAYQVNQPIPRTIEYNSGGWRGTLTIAHQQSAIDIIFVTYSGTVSCPGTCVMP